MIESAQLSLMSYMAGWFPFNFIREMAPLILNVATHCHTTERVLPPANNDRSLTFCNSIRMLKDTEEISRELSNYYFNQSRIKGG